MSRTSHVAIAAAVVISGAIGFALRGHAQATDTLEGFSISEVRFDESTGTQKPTPRLPRQWKFIGVSNGQKLNENNLWFQSEDGAIYVVQGFTVGGKFIMHPEIGRIEPK
jgi:hypothetical protein